MRHLTLAIGFFLLSFILPLRAMAVSFDNIYVFGDSFSDNGNLYKANGGVVPPSPPYYQGRSSNGPVWAEYLAQDLGLTPDQSTNLAYGGASSGLYNFAAPSSLPSLYLTGLLSQVDNFTAASESVDPNALYIVWAGGNDFLFGGVTAPSQPVMNISTAVGSLAAVGAKNIMVVNLPNLGNLPGTINSTASSFLSYLTTEYNASLATSLETLSQQLSGVNIISFDVNSLFNQVFANPGQYGFTNVTDSCIGNSGLAILPASSTSDACNTNPSEFFFWDSIHPTTTAHEIIAENAYSLLEAQSVPEPSAVSGLLIFAALGTVSLHKRKQKKG